MTTKTGFIQCVIARNKKYYYLRRAYRDSSQQVKKENIYNFGRKEKALSTIESWLNNSKCIPEEMNKYDVEDFKKWIDYINEKEN
ncbi:hypothetical protein SFC08_16840 [Lysinibacillus halotolerans]